MREHVALRDVTDSERAALERLARSRTTQARLTERARCTGEDDDRRQDERLAHACPERDSEDRRRDRLSEQCADEHFLTIEAVGEQAADRRAQPLRREQGQRGEPGVQRAPRLARDEAADDDELHPGADVGEEPGAPHQITARRRRGRKGCELTCSKLID